MVGDGSWDLGWCLLLVVENCRRIVGLQAVIGLAVLVDDDRFQKGGKGGLYTHPLNFHLHTSHHETNTNLSNIPSKHIISVPPHATAPL